MNKQTFLFISAGGVIPGIPGMFSAGTAVDVDVDAQSVLAVRPITLPPDVPAESTQRIDLVQKSSEDDTPDAPLPVAVSASKKVAPVVAPQGE